MHIGDQELTPSRLLLTTLALSLLSALVKFVVAWWTHSLAVLADAAFSLLALTANLTGLLMLWLEIRSESPSDTLAARRLQTSVTMVLCGVLALTAWEILGAVIERTLHGEKATKMFLPPIFILAAAAVGQGLWWSLIRKAPPGRALRLTTEVASIQNYTTGAAALGILGLSTGWMIWDSVAAVVVLVFFARTTYRTVDRSVTALTQT